MRRRYLSELVGQIDPSTKLTVMKLPPFNFEYQVAMHLASHMRQWPDSDKAEAEDGIRRRLSVGQSCLWDEPVQLSLF